MCFRWHSLYFVIVINGVSFQAVNVYKTDILPSRALDHKKTN